MIANNTYSNHRNANCLRLTNKNMKKQEIVNELVRISELSKAAEIKAEIAVLIEALSTAPETDKGKLTYKVTVNEQVLDPAHKYPKQMLECYKIIKELDKEELTLAEIKDAIGVSAERLGTRQDPYRIYAFYQKRMADEGWIGRAKERV